MDRSLLNSNLSPLSSSSKTSSCSSIKQTSRALLAPGPIGTLKVLFPLARRPSGETKACPHVCEPASSSESSSTKGGVLAKSHPLSITVEYRLTSQNGPQFGLGFQAVGSLTQSLNTSKLSQFAKRLFCCARLSHNPRSGLSNNSFTYNLHTAW